MLEKGTIKVVWITKNVNRIYSRMFSNVEQAEKFGKLKRDYLIFRLVWRKKFQEFSWMLLPCGNYKLYVQALKFYQKYKSRRAMLERLFRA